jgi:hypothetical protein
MNAQEAVVIAHLVNASKVVALAANVTEAEVNVAAEKAAAEARGESNPTSMQA